MDNWIALVKALFCQEGEMVAEGCALVELEPAG
jgi:3-methylcrotonyl-CoA carboxylase alpha subunit